jgi:hypothetical protein
MGVHFVGYYMGQGCFSQAGRAVKKDMFEGFGPLSGGCYGYGEFFLYV